MLHWRVMVALGLLAAVPAAWAGEGMWTLDNLPVKTLQEKYGFTPGAAWVQHVQGAALRLAGGCSGSFVSADGLVMTNHHCANECLAQISTPKKNYMSDAFIARSEKDEVRCPEIELNQLLAITDVTAQVNAATAGKSGADFIKAQRAVIGNIENACAGKDARNLRCEVVSLYHGGRYDLYKYKRYQDVRLVFAPQQAIAFFGGDPDNFNFPRYDLDVTFLRAYEHGQPAHTPDFFKFNPAGPKAGELTFVVGNPGSTMRNYTIAQLKSLRDDRLLPLYGYLSEMRGVLWEYSRRGPEQAQQAGDELFGVDNSIKAFTGQLQTLNDPAFWAYKQKQEDALKAWVHADAARRAEYGDPWASIAKAEQVYAGLATPYRMLERGQGFDARLFQIARALVRGAIERAKPNAERLPPYRDSNLPALEQFLFSTAPVHPQFERTQLAWSLEKLRQALGVDAPIVQQVLGKQAPSALAAQLVDGSKLASIAERRKLWAGGLKAIDASQDPMIRLALKVDPAALAVRKQVEDEVDAPVRKASELIAKAQFARLGTSIYPDATFTLRLSYGQVKGWDEHGKPVPPFTHFAGLYQRATGSDPFKLPADWIAAKDKLDLRTPFDFVTTNDIIGGNSGSPVINRQGEVVGLIFDGNIHSLGGAFWYDARLNRAVAVDSAALIEAIRTVYGDQKLADELVNGKR
ncbi:MAG: S46 family peptidase [Proteobacteria bacterium]|nr:S46 family peptidase [Pseudomonadota bacterium]